MRHHNMTVCFVFALLLASAPLADGQQAPLAGLDDYITRAMRDWEVPGLALAVVKDDKVVLARGYGVRRLGEPARVDERTLFAIGSSSKAFTTAALAILVDEGKLKWDDPVSRYLPWFELSDPYVTRELTVRDLPIHRVGIQRADYLWSLTPFDRDDILRRARYLKREQSFRYLYGYHNIMYLAAGQLIPALTGQSWDAFLRQRLFTPLGMTTSTTTTNDLTARDNVASPHERIEGRLQPVPWRNIDNIGPAGSVISSAREMAEWLRLHLGEGVHNGRRLLSAEVVREMHSPQTILPRSVIEEAPGLYRAVWTDQTHFMLYGFGWFLQDYRGRKVVWHGGSIDGMNSAVAMLPEEKLGVVVLTNVRRAGYTALLPALVWWVFDAYLGVAPRDWSGEILGWFKSVEEQQEARQREAQKRVEGTRASLSLGDYAGSYVDCVLGRATVSEQAGALVFSSPVWSGPLTHWHYDTFKLDWKDQRAGNRPRTALATFRLNARGQVDELAIGPASYRRAPEGADGNWRPAECR